MRTRKSASEETLKHSSGRDFSPTKQREHHRLRLIYESFMKGMTPIGICHLLEHKKIPTPGKKKKWRESTVLSILSNEKYKGDALLQKTFTVDFLTKKQKVNEGEVPRYYVTGSHEPIISPSDFDKVQEELARRKTISRKYSGNSILSSKIVCGDCGNFYGPKVWHSNDPYRKIIWQCGYKYGKGTRCTTPTITEETIKQLFLKAYNLLMADRVKIAGDCRELADMLNDVTAIDAKMASVQKEIEKIVALNHEQVHAYAADANREEYERKSAELHAAYKKQTDKLAALEKERADHLARAKVVNRFITEMLDAPLVLTEWQGQLWSMMVDKIIVKADGTADVCFKGENKITVEIE